jgi:hypothetical protein
LEGDFIRHQVFDGAPSIIRETHSDRSQLTKTKSEIIISGFFRALEPADLAIEISDFHITAVHKLASGRQRLHVCIGVDGFVRNYAIVSIN